MSNLKNKMEGELKAVYSGTLVHSTNETRMKICAERIIGIDKTGKIVFEDDVARTQEMCQRYSFSPTSVTYLKKRQFLMPGLVDTHIHAPQYVNAGTGHDLPLLAWLEKYTFPTESMFKDLQFAKDAYQKVVRRLLNNGTTTASYFATLHLEATKLLCNVINDLGQRAYVGKVCMDRNNCPEYYRENTEESAVDTEVFIKFVLDQQNPLLTPVITPRFAVSCTSELLLNLGEIAETYDLPIQSHLNENKSEIQLVQELFQDSDSYTGVYKDHGLLNKKTYMAHCCHMMEDEVNLLVTCQTGVSHCPTSNFALRSGITDVRHLLKKSVKVGLGTDVSGGCNPSMLFAIRDCVTASNAISLNREESYQPLDYKDAFFLATLGGSQVLGLEEKIGNFEVGKEFDALLVDADADNSPFDCFDKDTFEDIVQKFLYLGDDRNLAFVWVAGKPVAGTCHSQIPVKVARHVK